ncbi:MAG: cytochrome b6-f complex subunit PetM [Cyanobacteria bacterium P01_F01_bin.153]
MAAEIFSTAFLCFSVVLIGLSCGFVLLRLQGSGE